MDYYTPVHFTETRSKINYRSNLIFMGSCFSENIGNWLESLRFNVKINPFGITYNPISISQQVSLALSDRDFSEMHLVKYNNVEVHLDLHKKVSPNSSIISWLKTTREEFKTNLLSTSHLFLTFGTSYAFRYLSTGEIINNCQKLPGTEFEKVLLNETEMFNSLESTFQNLIEFNPNLNIYLTVSPIRHLRNGAIGNQRSKARLIRLSEMLEQHFEHVQYIPIYELIMDELRDYRFYKSEDMIHLNYQGLETVKECIRDYFIDRDAYGLMERVDKWLKMKNHIVQNADSSGTIRFQSKLKKETAELERIFSGL